MKGVVLAGGKGTRLRPITHSMAKQLVPVANQPILFYGLKDLAAAGVEDVAIVISPETGSEIRESVGTGEHLGINATYIVQERPDGIADALRLALPFVDGAACVLYLGDNLVKGGVADIIRDFENEKPNCQIMLARVDEPELFGVADFGADGSIRRLVEKPSDPPSDYALVGIYLFDSQIRESVHSIEPSARGELEITDAIQHLIDRGLEVRSTVVGGWWKDTGRKEDLLHANELVLADLEGSVEGEVIGGGMSGPVLVAPGAKVVDCVVTGPAVIGEGTLVERSVLGPNTSVGKQCHLSDCGVAGSIVMDGVRVDSWNLRDSLLGRDSALHQPAPPTPVAVTLGEHSEIGTA